MKKIEILLGQPVLELIADYDSDCDYWAFPGVFPDEKICEMRKAGINLTVMNGSPHSEDDVFQAVAMAMVHNLDWKECLIRR